MRKLLNDTSTADVQFVIKDNSTESKQRIYHGHRLILSTRSEVFRAMFRNPMKEANRGTVQIEGVTPEAFSKMLEYTYCSTVSFTTFDEVLAVMRLADQYLIHSLRNYCESVLITHLSIENAAVAFQDAHTHNLLKLRAASLNLIVENFAAICDADNFLSTIPTNPDLMREVLLEWKKQNHKK